MNAKAARRSLITLLILTAPVAFAQSAAELQKNLLQDEQRVAELQATNQGLNQQLRDLQAQVKKLSTREVPEQAEWKAAQSRYDAAGAALQETPSTANRQHLEDAKFDLVIAERKYQRATRGISRLRTKEATLLESLDVNQQEIANTLEAMTQRRDWIVKQESEAKRQATEKARREKQRRIAREHALQKQEKELQRTKADHAAAMAEIEKLRSKLAAGKSVKVASAAPARTPIPVKSPTSNTTRTSSAKRSAADSKSLTATLVKGGRKEYYRLLKTARQDQSRARKMQKVMHIKTYNGDRVYKQTSHSLKYLGNGLYEAKSVIRAGRTEFLVGRKKWIQQIPTDLHQDQYVFILDHRNTASPQLLLFARSELQ